LSSQIPYIKDWLQTYAKKNTRRVFLAGVKHFLSSVYSEKKGLEDLETLAAQYILDCKNGSRDWFKDLLKFAADLHERPPKSARAFMAGVRSWLEYCLDIELTRKQSRLLLGRLPKGLRARTEEAELSRETLRKILAHADLKGRALFLFLASSGVRIGEALKLKLQDVNLNVDPPIVTVRGEYTKSGDSYTSFLSSEAKEALEQWLRVREDYIRSATNRGRGLGRIKNTEDARIFPFSPAVAEAMWYTVIEKAGLNHKDSSTGRYKLHIHMLRKWFLSQAKLAAPESVVEAWAGHSGYLDEAYRRYSMDQLREFYKKAETYLFINIPKDISQIQTKFQKDVDEMRDRIADLTRKLTDANATTIRLMNENVELKAKLETVTREIEELKKIIQDALGTKNFTPKP
jgi:integrase